MTHQGLFRLPNPFASSESNFGAISEWAASQFSLTVYESTGAVGAENRFVTYEKSFEGFFEVAATQFSLTVYESKGVVWADECIHHV
jgi:hypothetical protein